MDFDGVASRLTTLVLYNSLTNFLLMINNWHPLSYHFELFTEFTDSSNATDSAGKHRLSPYIAYYYNV